MANYALAISIVPSIVQTVAFGGISGAYAGIGAALTRPARLLTIDNLTDGDLMISIDGVNDYFVIPARSGRIFDWAANQALGSGGYVAQGTRYYVKQITAPTSGSIYLTYFYGNST